MKFDKLIEYNMNITSFKYCEENEVGRVVLDLFFFFRKALYVVKANVQRLSFNMFLCSPWTYNKNKLYNCSDFWSRDKLDFDFFRKSPETSFWTTFCVWFFKENVSNVIFYHLTRFHCLIAFSSWDIGQYVYWNYLLLSLWRHKFWN